MKNCILFAILAMIACGRPSTTKNDPQLAIDSISNAIQDQVLNYLLEMRNDAARKYLDSIYPNIIAGNHKEVLSTWWRLRGATFMLTEQQDSARIYAERAMQLVNQQDTTNKYVLWAKRDLGLHYTITKEYDKAIRYNMDVYAHKEKLDTNLVVATLGQMADLFQQVGDSTSELKYWMEGYQMARNPRLIYTFATNISNLYEAQGKWDSVKKYREIAYPYIVDFNNRVKAINVFNKAEALRQNKEYASALPLYHQAIEIVREDTAFIDGTYYLGVAFCERSMNNILLSNTYIDTAIQLSRKRGDYQKLADAYTLYASNQASIKAFAHSYQLMDLAVKHHKAEDSASFQAKARDLEAKYQARIKDQRITSLAREKALSDQVGHQRLISLILVIAAGIFGITVIVLLGRKRQTDLQTQQTYLYLRLLRTQIDPHFMFNALSVLKAYLRENKIAAEYLGKLAKLLRWSLVNANSNYVPLQDELEALHNYIDMQKIHYTNKFDYEIKIYDGHEEDDILIPPMLIQPFVENAIVHGVSELGERVGHIRITIEKERNVLRCIIEDNGEGLKPVVITDAREAHATTITTDRLKVLGKQLRRKASLNIEPIDKARGSGVIVTMIVPYKHERLMNNVASRRRKSFIWNY